jgi:fatty-acyl-CoA synthase
MNPQLWPHYSTPADLAAIETVPLSERGLPTTTYAMLARAARMFGARPAVSVLPDGQQWRNPLRRSFTELLADVHQAANLLHGLGVRRTDAVAIIAPNCDELITATLAAQLAGIAAPINGALSAGHIADLVARAGARVLITAAPELDETAWTTAGELVAAGAIDAVLLVRPTAAPPPAGAAPSLPGATVDYLTDSAAQYPADYFTGARPEPGDLAALFHTGGTTGAPKLAAHTHANEVTDAWMIAANTVLDERAVVFAALPLFHVNALVVTTLAPMLRGQHTVWAGPLGYRDMALYGNFWQIVEHYRLATMSAVPTVYSVLARVAVDADISSMRVAVVGASALPAAVRKEFESHTGISLVEGYGLTEATCASTRSFPHHPRHGSVGQRLPYQHIKTVRIDEDGRWHDLPRGRVGTLVISGPTVFGGYVTGRNADGYILDGKSKLVGGWLDTGDLAWIDDDDFIHLSGRAKDLIIRGGHNIDPAMVEDALLSHDDVTAAAAVGRPDPHAGEVPVAYVTLVPGATVTEDALRQWAAEQVAEPAAAPKQVTAIDAIPMTAVGKVYKLPLRADAVRIAVTEALIGVTGIDTIAADAEDGATVVTIAVDPSADRQAIDDILTRYTLTYRIAER